MFTETCLQRTPKLKKLFSILMCLICFSTLDVWAEKPSHSKSKRAKSTLSENGQVLLADRFDSLNSKWQPIYLEGAGKGGSYSASNGRLLIELTHPNSIYGLYRPTPISGHFYAEVEFENDDFCGLAIVQAKNGKPDPNNFTSIHVSTNDDGKVVVSLRDRQNGIDDVLDNTGRLGEKRYEHVLTGNQYSVPFNSTNKKFRIFRDGPAGFFHLYYAVGQKIKGEWAEGWIELAPSKDWAKPGQEYYVVLYTRSSEESSSQAAFDNLRVVQKPTQDQDDTQTGFKAVRRDYNWSGFFGDAVVISFGDEFDYHDSDRKFVFWSAANYIPGWHMDNQLFFTYEFVETGGDKGCYEPMSDRLLRWSNVEIMVDNDVRKIVHWHYVLCNPDYTVPTDSEGTQLPEADEYWTFYPDGTGIRYIVYTPKLDSSFRKGHELTELIVVAGSLTHPIDHVASPALTVLNISGDAFTYNPGAKFDEKINKWWNQIILAAHFKNAPDAFNVFSHGSDIPETYSGYRIKFEVSWHNTIYRMCHWPVGVEPYQLEVKTFGNWRAQVSHSSLISGGVYRKGTDWNDHYKIDKRGRKYRDWISLVGLNEPGYYEGLRMKTASWLYPGSITSLNPSCPFEKINYKRKEFIFNNTNTTGDRLCYFTLDPTAKSTTVINPVFTINNWGDYPVEVILNGKRLVPVKDFKFAFEGNSVVIWVKGQFNSPTTFKIQKLSSTSTVER